MFYSNEKIVKCGKYIEKRTYDKHFPVDFVAKERAKTGRRSGSRRVDNVTRARNSLLRRVLSNTQDTKPLFFTLTYASNMQDRDKAVKDFKKLMAHLRWVLGGIQFLYVLERQERGAWHIHFLVFDHAFIRIEMVRRLWRNVIKEQARVNVKRTNDALHVANYLAKYLGKDINNNNKRAFAYSRGLASPRVFYANTFARNYSLAIFGDVITDKGYFPSPEQFVKLEIYYENESTIYGRGSA